MTPFGDKENIVPNNNSFSQALGTQDRDFLKLNIVGALDHVVHLVETQAGKLIVSSIENIIYNIAQCDYEVWYKTCLKQQMEERLQSGNESAVVSGLRTLKAVIQAHEFEIHEDRRPLNDLMNTFFPELEKILGSPVITQSPNYISTMILIAKIFFMTNQVSPITDLNEIYRAA